MKKEFVECHLFLCLVHKGFSFVSGKISTPLIILFLPVIILSCAEKKEYALRTSLNSTLEVLDSTLFSLQVNDTVQPDFGALWCDHCKLFHTRAAEAVYPFAYLFSVNGDRKYLDASIRVGNWLIRQQFPDGSWKETPEEWTGTTTDQLLMMAKAYPVVKDHLSGTEQTSWIKSMKMAGDYLYEVMTPEFASINYVATTTATLMVLHGIIPDGRFAGKARQLAHLVIAKMDDDLFITGEGGRVFDAKYGVDLGYNLEMSLWGLALYAKLSGDTLVMNKVVKSAVRHLHFIYPDGSVDGSWGIRSNKWTCFGGATSDGIQVLCSLLGNQDPGFYTVSARNLEYLKTCMKNGLVGYGPMHWDIMHDDPCIYPTFAKAKNLAMALAYLEKDPPEYPGLPNDQSGLTIFPTLNLATIRTKNFCATVTAYGYKDPKGSESKYMFRPTGGAISNLWLAGWGYLTASSQTEYHRWEPMHFPEADTLKSLTPRIEFTNENGYFTNLFEFDATVFFEKNGSSITAEVYGELKNREQKEGGIGYSYRYTFEDDCVTKEIHLRFHAVRDTVIIVEPFIFHPQMQFVQVNEKTVLVSNGNQKIEMLITGGLASLSTGEDTEHYWWPYPALRAFPVTLRVIPDESTLESTVKYRFRLEKQKDKALP
jgi:hypothetical protein